LKADILKVEGVSKSFGGIKAVVDCSLKVKTGQIAGLIGPNGAGKSTLFEMVAGDLLPDAGRIYFLGESIVGVPGFRTAREGLIRTFQIPRALNRMTVLENMMLSSQGQMGEKIENVFFRWRDVQGDEKKTREKALSVLDFFSLGSMADEYAGALSGGQKKLLAMARTMMADPKMLLLDEPFAGVNPTLSKKLVGRIKELRDEGVTFLIIEHGIPYVKELCDLIYVMNKGEIMTSGPPDVVTSDMRVLEAYLGGGINAR
jgi:ABC-type branched-subunit amino acid transport system ATPase component